MQKVVTLLLVMLTMAGMGAAQTSTEDVGTGLIDPTTEVLGVNVYGLEVAAENIAAGVGLRDKGAIAEERAAEIDKALDSINNDTSSERAADIASNIDLAATTVQGIANESDSRAQDALTTVQQTLGNVSSRLTEVESTINEKTNTSVSITDGVDTALDKTQEALDRPAPDDDGTTPVGMPDGQDAMDPSDCEGMPHPMVLGEWAVQNGECVWVADDVPGDDLSGYSQ